MAEKGKKEKPIRILFDVAHGETMDVTSDDFKDFKEFLSEMNYEVWQLSQRPLTYELVSDYSILFIGAPKSNKFETEEIVEILKFLREGGAVVLISNAGGDQYNATNLNDIANHFGFQFNGDYLAHEEDYESDDFYQTICRGVGLTPITMGVRSVFTGSCCTIKIIDPSASKSLVFSHEPFPEVRHVAINGFYDLGRFFATSAPIFQYVKRHDNKFFLQSVFYWLKSLRGNEDVI
ncbi:MAG: hypothetical protein GY870_17035 [archaeon]|nr:hypothetical protein [archaeon]